MINLTEKWKKGELEEGWYYILNQLDVIRIEQANVWIGRYKNPFVGFDDDSGIKEVITPVPTYEELQQLKQNAVKAANNALDTFNENTKLRQLLKECYTIVDTRMLNLRGLYNTDGLEVYKRESERLKKLLTKINEVLK